MLRNKPGLSMVVKSEAGNEGKIVTCIEYIGMQKWRCIDNIVRLKHTWKTDTTLTGWCKNSKTNLIPDEHMTPIDNPSQDEQDETLSWLPVPTELSICQQYYNSLTN